MYKYKTGKNLSNLLMIKKHLKEKEEYIDIKTTIQNAVCLVNSIHNISLFQCSVKG